MIQIIGTNKCKETQKAIRYFKERRLEFQYVNLNERDLSRREWESRFRGRDAESCLDTEGDFYKKEGYKWREFDVKEEIMLHKELLKIPILRDKDRCMIGFDPDKFSLWIKK